MFKCTFSIHWTDLIATAWVKNSLFCNYIAARRVSALNNHFFYAFALYTSLRRNSRKDFPRFGVSSGELFKYAVNIAARYLPVAQTA